MGQSRNRVRRRAKSVQRLTGGGHFGRWGFSKRRVPPLIYFLSKFRITRIELKFCMHGYWVKIWIRFEEEQNRPSGWPVGVIQVGWGRWCRIFEMVVEGWNSVNWLQWRCKEGKWSQMSEIGILSDPIGPPFALFCVKISEYSDWVEILHTCLLGQSMIWVRRRAKSVRWLTGGGHFGRVGSLVQNIRNGRTRFKFGI